MTARLNPYIHFRDTAREAMEFYHSALGGELSMNTFGEFGMSQDPSEAQKIMHAQILAPNGFCLMASDTPNSMQHQPGTNITVSLSGTGEHITTLQACWDKLAEGSEVRQPLERAPWGDMFGMLTDRFGINWMINIGGAPQ